MRGSVSVCLMLAIVTAFLHLSSTSWAAEQQNVQPSSSLNSVEHRSWRRTKRQLSEVVRLYQTLVKENREDQMQARKRIQEILGRVFVSPGDATSTMAPSVNSTSSDGNSTVTPVSTPRPLAKIDRTMLLANLRRNLRGIGRLFMRELRAALSQSRTNLGTYWSQLRRSVQQPISVSKTRRQVTPQYQPHVTAIQPLGQTQYQPQVNPSQYQSQVTAYQPLAPTQYQPHVNPNQPYLRPVRGAPVRRHDTT